MTILTADATSDGRVLPIAWNMLEATKISPDATKFHEMIRRYSAPYAITAGSDEKKPTKVAGATWQAIASASIAAVAMYAAVRKVSFTRCAWRAPKFWPATGAT